ncbi:MAG: ABC transporter permease subunit [Pseudomonadota bacterium]
MRRLVNLHPGRAGGVMLALLPFILLLAAYLYGSSSRLAINPDDKLLPSISSIATTLHHYVIEEDLRSGGRLFWADTWASLARLGIALAISALLAMAWGVVVGTLPVVRSLMSPFFAALSMIPPLAILPILFIVMGLGEAAKITLIAIGITPCMIRDLSQKTQELPGEQMIKAQTLGASSWQLITRVVVPQIWPRLIDTLRLNLGAAWLFLIAAEAIASTEGLGYRIFLVRRYLSMDVILPYVMWITLLAFAMDQLLRKLRGRLFPWA